MRTSCGLIVFSIFFATLLATPQTEARSYLLAQNSASDDDTYDPFADYSEFEENSQEEADINFFRNGRFFTMGFILGNRGFTNNMANIYRQNAAFGMFLSYFFDLRFALQFGFNTGDHMLVLYNPVSLQPVSGSVSFTTVNFDLKFYLNTQNVTKGLADINPYLLIGFSQFHRTYLVSNSGSDAGGFAKDSALGVDLGGGVEIPMLRNKMFLGLQGTYHHVSFKDENTELQIEGSGTGIYPNGNIWDGFVILGLNF